MSAGATISRGLAANLARELGDGWTAEHPDDGDRWSWLVKGNRRISVHVGGWQLEDRVRFWGAMPTAEGVEYFYRSPDDKRRTEITCAATKTAAQMAKEIRRRLLPDYEALCDEAQRHIDRTLDGRRVRDATAEILAEAVGGETRLANRGEAVIYVRHGEGKGYLDVKVSAPYDGHGPTANVDFRSCPTPLVEQLLKLWRDWGG